MIPCSGSWRRIDDPLEVDHGQRLMAAPCPVCGVIVRIYEHGCRWGSPGELRYRWHQAPVVAEPDWQQVAAGLAAALRPLAAGMYPSEPECHAAAEALRAYDTAAAVQETGR